MQSKQFKALLQAAGSTPRRLPAPGEPLAIQRNYARKLKTKVLEDAMALIREYLVPQLERYAEQASRVATTDAADELGEVMDEIQARYFDKWTRRQFSKVVRPTAVETAEFQALQLNKQLGAALPPDLSVDVVGGEPWLAASIEEFTRENVALIRSLPSQLFTDVEKRVAEGVANGERFDSLVEDIEERLGVATSRAELIARDQVNKFQGDLNRVRQTDLGITSFVWRTMGDERVRIEHVGYNGESYEWANPPEGETPGEPINCRCWADPDLTALLEEIAPEETG